MHRLLVVVAVGILILPHNSKSASENEAEVIQYQYLTDGRGNYYYRFRTSNGITRQETGLVVDEGLPSQYILVKGKFTYYTPDGHKEQWMYTADKDGYHPQPITNANVPRIDSIPPGVLASLLGK